MKFGCKYIQYSMSVYGQCVLHNCSLCSSYSSPFPLLHCFVKEIFSLSTPALYMDIYVQHWNLHNYPCRGHVVAIIDKCLSFRSLYRSYVITKINGAVNLNLHIQRS